jgi:hypothetical protein
VSRNARIALVVVVVAAAVVGFVIANNSGSDKKTSTTTATVSKGGGTTTPTTARPAPPPVPVIQVKNAKPVGGIKDITVNKGDRVRFAVESDVGDEVHVHGYDFHKDVPAGGRVAFDFKATIDGVFVIELESRSEQIASLKVNP